MTAVFFGLLLGLQIKHFVADYLMQPGWILGGKGDLHKLGGYVHAGIHALFSVAVLLIFGTPLWLVGALFAGEAIVPIPYNLAFHTKCDLSHPTVSK